jgi:hypothetical protein
MKPTISLNPSSGDKKTTYCLQGASYYYYLLSSKMTPDFEEASLNLYTKVAFQIHKEEISLSDLCWLCCTTNGLAPSSEREAEGAIRST